MAGNFGPLQLFGDFGFSGGEDIAPNPLQDNQTCINWYAEVNKQNAKEILGLLGCPGLVQLVAAPGGGAPGFNPGSPVSYITPTLIFETDISTPTFATTPFFNVSTPWAIPFSVNSSLITLIDRAVGASTMNLSKGDGNQYNYLSASGTYSSTAGQSSSQAVWAYYAWQWSDSSVPAGARYGIGASAWSIEIGNNQSIGSGFTSGSGKAALYAVNGFPPSSATVVDLLPALSTVASVGDRLYGACMCADYAHLLAITLNGASGTTGGHWALLNVSGSPPTASLTASGTISAALQTSYWQPVSLFSGSGAYADSNAGSLSFPRGSLDSDLNTLWVLNPANGSAAQQCEIFLLNQSSGGGMSHQATIANVFPSHGALTSRPDGLVADNGVAVFTKGTAMSSWKVRIGSQATVSWPLPSTVTNLPVRGTWELPDGKTALAVIGNTCYLVTINAPATASSFATLALVSVGTLLTNIGPVHIRDNNVGGYAVIVDGRYGYLYNIATKGFSQITDPAFLGADTVAFIDGWWIFNQPGTQVFYTNFPQYGTGFNATYFALKDGAPDNLKAVFENKEQLWLLGDKTTEVWYDAGGGTFGFQRLVGTLMQFGCKAAHSVARFSTEGQDGVVLLGRSERGENVIIRTRGFNFDVVSTPAFGTEVATYPITSDAIGYTYQEDTHEFYMLTFPTADITWCYDAQSGLLHKRLSYDPYLQKFHRHRSNCFMNFQGMRIVGDYQCGALYQLTRNAYTDAGWPILAKRRSPHIWDKGQRGRVFMASLQLDFNPGVGNAAGLGSNPQAGISISRDGGKTFGQRWYAPIGKTGQYRTRTMWRKLAFGRDNVIDLEVIDPVKRDLVGVTLKAFSSG